MLSNTEAGNSRLQPVEGSKPLKPLLKSIGLKKQAEFAMGGAGCNRGDGKWKADGLFGQGRARTLRSGKMRNQNPGPLA